MNSLCGSLCGSLRKSSVRPLGGDRLAEQDGVGALHDPLQFRAPILDRLLADVLAVELHKVESDVSGDRCAGLCAEGLKVAASIGAEDDGFAVDQSMFDGKTANREGGAIQIK